MKPPTMRPLRPLLAALLSCAVPSCYLQLSGGLYSVHGGHATGTPSAGTQLSPSFGIAAGVMYDPLTMRAGAGLGTQSLTAQIGRRTQTALTGPLHVHADLALPFVGPNEYGRRVAFRLGAGGTTGSGSRFVEHPDGNVEARDYGIHHVYLSPSVDFLVGNAPLNFMSVGVGVTPGMFFSTGNDGLEDLYAFGADVRVTIAVPITREGIDLSNLFRRNLSPAEEAELDRQREQLSTWEAQRANQPSSDQQSWERQRQHMERTVNELQCRSAGGTRCSQ